MARLMFASLTWLDLFLYKKMETIGKISVSAENAVTTIEFTG